MYRLLYLITSAVVSAEVFTLIKKNDITCALVGDSVYTGLYLSSNDSDISVNRSLVLLTQWLRDDWNMSTTKEQSYYPVTDLRWEAFTKNTSGVISLNPNSVTAFSVCFETRLSVTGGGLETGYIKRKRRTRRSCEWAHYIVDVNAIVEISSEGNKTVKTFNSNYTFLEISKKKLYKKHDYDFRQSTTANLRDSSSIDLSGVSNSSDLCISMFVSIDVGCSLELSLQSTSIPIRVEGFNLGKLKIWKRVEIKTSSYNGSDTLTLKRISNKTSGYWAVDKIHLCKPTTEIFTKELMHAEKYRCNTLMATGHSSTYPFCRTAGYLDKDCTTNCTEVLGASYPFCAQHKICSESGICNCAWGFRGEICDQPCDNNRWGLNCSLQVKNCLKHSNVIGCTECKKGFFGEFCTVPVLLKAPVLTKITNNTLEINFDLEFSQDERVPEYYLVQYKQLSVKTFQNFSGLKPVVANNTVVITNVSPSEFDYSIRVLLLPDSNQINVPNNVPELRTFKRSLQAAPVCDNAMNLTWEELKTNATDEFLEVYHSQHVITRINTAVKTAVKVENLKPSSVYTFKLFSGTKKQIQLVDEVQAATLTLPEVSLFQNGIILKFKDCTHFSPSNFTLSLQCVSEWCLNETVSPKVSVDQCEQKKELHLLPFTNYSVKMVDLKKDHCSHSYSLISPPSRPHAVRNLSIESGNNTALWLKWRPPYPPTGVVEKYMITYKSLKEETERHTNSTHVCKNWKNFICAQLTDLKTDTRYRIMVRAKNADVSDWSNDTMLEQPLIQEVVQKSQRSIKLMLPMGALALVAVIAFLIYLHYRKRAPDSHDEELYLLPQKLSTSIKNENFEEFVRTLHDGNNLTRLKETFLRCALFDKEKSRQVASLDENVKKNKHQDYVPYDHTRVVLKDLKDVSSGDYINASYIQGCQQSYIACQGPKFNTVLDFWRMIWVEKVDVVVMATEFLESDGSRNCAEYWSHGLNKAAEFGKLSVKMTTEEKYQYYDFRILEICYLGTVREIRHLQVKWTQSQCPSPDEVLCVFEKLQEMKSDFPIVVHSGLGMNRNGMLILCDMAIKTAKNQGSVDFVNLLQTLRKQRPLIINNFDYFLLAHLTLLEFLLEEENPFKRNMDQILTTNCEEEIAYLEWLSLHDCVLLPKRRPKKKTNSSEFVVDGYCKNHRYLLRSTPSKKSIFGFWHSVLTSDVRCILCLNNPKDKLWPFKNSVDLEVIDCDFQHISLCYSVIQLVVRQSNGTHKNHIINEKKVLLFELMDWDSKKLLPESVTNILNLLKHLRDSVEEKEPILLLSHPDSNSGALTTILLNALDKYEFERKIDVFGFLRIMMRNNKHFRIQPIELKFIYSTIVEYLSTFDLKTHDYEYMEQDNEKDNLVKQL